MILISGYGVKEIIVHNLYNDHNVKGYQASKGSSASEVRSSTILQDHVSSRARSVHSSALPPTVQTSNIVETQTRRGKLERYSRSSLTATPGSSSKDTAHNHVSKKESLMLGIQHLCNKENYSLESRENL
jgi:hypothetical protein